MAITVFEPSTNVPDIAGTRSVVGLMLPVLSMAIAAVFHATPPIVSAPTAMVPFGVILLPVIITVVPAGPVCGVIVNNRVTTVKVVVAVILGVAIEAAVIVLTPADAAIGIVNVAFIAPVLVVVTLPAALPPKFIETISETSQPVPVIVTVAPGNPLAGVIANVGITVKTAGDALVLPAPSVAVTLAAPEVNAGTVPVAVKLPVASTATPDLRLLPPIFTSAVTPAPLNPVPTTVILDPTAPFWLTGDDIANFGCTVKYDVIVLTPSVTWRACAPAAAVGTNTAKVAAPVVSAVTVDGAVVIATPSNLAVRIVLAPKPVAVTVTDVPTTPEVGLIGAVAALAGIAAIATRLPRIASTASSFTIFVFILI